MSPHSCTTNRRITCIRPEKPFIKMSCAQIMQSIIVNKFQNDRSLIVALSPSHLHAMLTDSVVSACVFFPACHFIHYHGCIYVYFSPYFRFIWFHWFLSWLLFIFGFLLDIHTESSEFPTSHYWVSNQKDLPLFNIYSNENNFFSFNDCMWKHINDCMNVKTFKVQSIN